MDIKTKDHSHLVTNYRRSSHNKCNIIYSDGKYIPILFLNLSSSDSNFIILIKLSVYKIMVFPGNKEQYISLSK